MEEESAQGDPESLLARIDVEPSDSGVHATALQSFGGRAFGGELLAKAVAAAGVGSAGVPHSLHGFFLRAAVPDVATDVRVEVLREGRRLSHRRVAIEQQGRRLAEFLIACQIPPEGVSYEERDGTSDVPPPEDLTETRRTADQGVDGPEPTEWRFVERPWGSDPTTDGRWRAWVRPRRELPDEPRLHAAALAYLSDYGSVAVLERRFGERFVWDESTSLDHALWLHPEPRWDDWLLMDSRSEVSQRGRSLTERTIWTRDGTRMATVLQEALFTVRDR